MHDQNPLDINIFDLLALAPAAPSAGANFSLAVNLNARWRITAIRFTFTTDANAANRRIQVGGIVGTINFALSGAGDIQTASEARNYDFNVGTGSAYSSGDADNLYAPLNSQMYLEVGDSLRIIIANIQAGDAITNIGIRLQQWITED